MRKRDYEKILEKKKKEEILEVLSEVSPGLELEVGPKEARPGFQPYTSDYRQFLKEIKKRPETVFEKLCSFFERLGIEPDPKTRSKLESEIETAYLNVTPRGVYSFSVAVMAFFLTISFFLFFTGFLSLPLLLMSVAGSLLAGYAVASYPSVLSKTVRMKMASDMVLAVLYMVIYMRSSPQLEGAVKFAAENLPPPLSWDLKKLIWDVEVGVYDSMDTALTTYLTRWKDKNEEFSEALHILRNSTSESEERRHMMLDEAVSVILNGTRERMKHYAQNLRLPVLLIHAMGILLPLIGMVMFPIIVIFMSETVKPVFIFLGYDVILPLFLFYYMSHVLRTKPATFSQPDISLARGVPPLGRFRLGGKNLPVAPFAALVSVPVILAGLTGFGSPDPGTAVSFSVLVVLGIAAGIATYCLLDSFQKMKIRKDVERIEREFADALFQLGNYIAGGTPIEVAVDRAWESLRHLKISDLFLQASLNMKKLGMTFHQALFDKKYGAVWNYPSRLVRSVMETVTEASKKGVKIASMTMLTISRYLKSIHAVKEDIREILSETTTSLRFIAMILAPVISGIVVTMALIIIQIITSLTAQLSDIYSESEAMGVREMLIFAWGQCGAAGCGGPPVPPQVFQLVVGIYLLETVMLLGFFLNRLEYGEDSIGLRDTLAKILIFASVIYVVSWFTSFTVFSEPIKSFFAVG